MALIDCPDCTRSVSDQAPSCPNCGRPISTDSLGTQENPEVIEATGKQWKLGKLIGGLGFVGGLVMLASAPNEYTTTYSLGQGFMTLGLGVFVVSWLAAWWYHR